LRIASPSKGWARTQSLSTALVDLNPHQVDVALFTLSSPLSKGALMAEEVGLGKTLYRALAADARIRAVAKRDAGGLGLPPAQGHDRMAGS
jgi:hypothetical protein